MLRCLHTSDWHLGHRLFDQPRVAEHRAFLEWLLELIVVREIDALIVAGDVFDGASPSPRTQRIFYDFLGRARRVAPELDIVVVAGNHDSASRLEAPHALASRLGIHLVGRLPRVGNALDPRRLLIELKDATGTVRAQLAAIPFLRRADLTLESRAPGSFARAIAAVYEEAAQCAAQVASEGQALIATGHLFAAGGELSEDSERRIQMGYLEAVGPDVFPELFDYVALGHLHKPQRVGGLNWIRYAGAPIPLAMSEGGRVGTVVVAEFDGGSLRSAEPIEVPRFVDMRCVPEEHADLETVLVALSALPRENGSGAEPPWLEVRVRLQQPQPRLRELVEEALDGAFVRLVRIDAQYSGTGEALAEREPLRTLTQLTPHDVLARRWEQQFEGEIPSRLIQRFNELVERVQQAEP